MTTREMILEAWELAGEPQDLDPYQINAPSSDPIYFDATSIGVSHYLRAITNAQNMLANWKTPRGRPIRFRRFYRQKNVKLGRTDVMDCTVNLADKSSIRIDNPPAWLNPDYMDTCRLDVTWSGVTDNGTVVVAVEGTYEAAGMTAEWTDATQTAMYVYFMEDLDIPDIAVSTTASTCTVSFDRYTIVGGTGMGDYVTITLPTTFRNVMRVSTASDGSMLPMVGYREDLMNPQLTDGTPSEWYTIGDRVFFDVYLTEPTWFTLEYQTMPLPITDLDQAIDIPEEWHSVILMLIVWQESKRLQDVEKEAMLKSQLNSTINLLRTDAEEEFLRESTSGFKVVREAR